MDVIKLAVHELGSFLLEHFVQNINKEREVNKSKCLTTHLFSVHGGDLQF